jgi:hypothetical protein
MEFENIIHLRQGEKTTVYSPSVTNATKSNIVIADSTGKELISLEYLNDISEYTIKVEGIEVAQRSRVFKEKKLSFL